MCVSELWGTEDSAILSEARKLANNSAYQNGTFKVGGGGVGSTPLSHQGRSTPRAEKENDLFHCLYP